MTTGYILNNRYRIENVIGRGGLSVVYKATDLEANGAVRAVKEISGRCTEMILSAKKESQLIKELYEHDKSNFFPNIIQRIETPEALYIVMDYIDGVSMNTLLKSGALSHRLTIGYGKDICSVIQFLHDYGKIYSDMKPDNVMIINNSDASKTLGADRRISTLKLIDFGAVIQTESGIPIQYTPEYAAPEQFLARHLDERTDIFNIGATLYHMITGRKPLPVNDENQNCRSFSERFIFDKKDKNINAHLKKIIRKCVENDPDKRYPSCRELYRALEKAEKQTHIKLTLLSSAAAVFSAIACIISYSQFKSHEKLDYDRYLMTADKSASYSEKISAYKDAIELRKDRTEAYFGLIEAYKEDICFDEQESTELTKIIAANSAVLKENTDYELLAFETARLYWYYYEYGNGSNTENSTTRIISSTEWFSEALGENLKTISGQKYHMAQVYYDIGKFHSDIQQLVIEGDDTDVYADYWKSINDMVDFIDESQTETEIVLLETYKLAINSLETYSYKFSSYIEEQELRAFFEKIRTGTDTLMTTTEKTDIIKKSITDRYEKISEVINNAYGGK
ncbi:MAG: serine/threonine protein kinase [Ruminococcus sp.]|nr:serine/threonine protein kinase [Ruminococcus sp.]